VCFTCEEERLLARQSFRLYRCTERVLNYGTSAPIGDPQLAAELFLNRFPHLRGKRVVLFLGRLHPKKGCDLLLRAFQALLSERSALAPEAGEPHLVMAGPDQIGWLPELQALAGSLGIAGRVTWPGMLSGELKHGALRTAAVFALPSHQENFGLAVAEALSCGLPVLISNQVNIWREIESDGAGLVADDDANGTVELLRRWFALSAPEQDACRARASRCFAARFEIRHAADSLIRLLESNELQ
jgi:glycosyltransferase involved in cell wall biosynthesis